MPTKGTYGHLATFSQPGKARRGLAGDRDDTRGEHSPDTIAGADDPVCLTVQCTYAMKSVVGYHSAPIRAPGLQSSRHDTECTRDHATNQPSGIPRCCNCVDARVCTLPGDAC